MTELRFEALFARRPNYCLPGGAPLALSCLRDDTTLTVVKKRIEATCQWRIALSETIELGSNLMLFFFKLIGQKLTRGPDLDRVSPTLPLVKAGGGGGHQYRLFRFDEAGAIKACFIFLRRMPA